MTAFRLAAPMRRIAFFTVFAACLWALAPATLAQPSSLATSPPPTSFAEASRLFRAGRHAAAYGRFVRLANEGDREAARVALVMHRHGAALFGSAWDATTEELVEWARLAQLADRADVEARPGGAAQAFAIGATPAGASVLSPETFRSDRRRKR